MAGSFQVFSRLVTCMSGAPLNIALTRRAREALRLTRALAPWFHSSLESVVNDRYDMLETIMDGKIIAFIEYRNQGTEI